MEDLKKKKKTVHTHKQNLALLWIHTVPILKRTKLVSLLSVHMVNRLLHEDRKSIPNFFNGKNLFKNVTLQILNFILVSLIIKIFSICCNVNFMSVFTA